MNTKLSISVVVALVLQISAFVWWTAQQAQTISQLSTEVSDLTSKMAVESEINMSRDIEDMKQRINDHDDYIEQNYLEIIDLVDFATFTENKWAKAYDESPGYERKFGTRPASED